MAQEMSEVNLDLRYCGKRSKIRLLPNGLIGIAWSRADTRGEIANGIDLVRRHQVGAKRVGVQPLVRCASQAAIIKIEPVDIDSCSQLLAPTKSSGGPEGPPRAPAPKRRGGYVCNIGIKFEKSMNAT
jgi:hypothetical protein